MASEFGTSLTATTRSFLSLTNLPCALVWSAGQRARWCARSDSFQFFLPLDELPADGSFAADLFSGKPAPSDFAPVAPTIWLDARAAERVETLLEHSVRLPSYDAVLTLLWAYKTTPVSHDSGEDELLEELDPADFTLGRRRWPR